MLDIVIPGYKTLHLKHLVLDFNGTLAYDGNLIEGVKERLHALVDNLKIHVLTADTFGTATESLSNTPCEVSILPLINQNIGKLNYIEQLGVEETVCIGNGRNDRLMLKAAVLGIAVLQREGASVEALMAADIVVPNITDALDLLKHPLRLVATLRC